MSRRRPSHTTFQPRACTRDSLTIQQSKSNVLLSTTSCRHIRTRPTRSLIRIGDCRNLSEKTTRRMAIANGTCVSFCNQPNAQFAYLRGVTPVCHCLHPFYRWRHLATSRESKAHSGPVHPWDNRGKCHMDEKRIQCLSNASQHVPTYLEPFPNNSTRKFKSSPFSTFFAHFGLPWVCPWDNRGECYMNGKRIQC